MRAGAGIVRLQHRNAVSFYKKKYGRDLRLSPPVTAGEKIHWRKFFDHNPLFVTFNDKLAVKDWVHARLPDLKIPRTMWVGEAARDLPDDVLGRPVMIKGSHGCNYNILHDGTGPERAVIEAKFDDWLSRPYGTFASEWAYGPIPRRIFVEELVTTHEPMGLTMLGVNTFGGEVSHVAVSLGPKDGDRFRTFMDETGRPMGLRPTNDHPPLPPDWHLPETFFRAVEAARVLGRDVDYVRCDFLCTDTDVWFSELTTYPSSGHREYDDRALEERVYAKWDLGQSWFLQTPQRGWREVYRKAMIRDLQRARAS